MTDRVHVFVEGRAQGVGFRYSTFEEAQVLGLTVWVRNLPDGRVEAEFEGPKAALDRMVEWCGVGPRAARVTRVETAWETGSPRYSAFQFRG